MFFQNSIGIDLQEDKVLIGWLRSSVTGLDFAGFECYCPDPGEKEDILLHADAYLSDFTNKHGINTFDLYLGISGKNCLKKTIELPSSVKDELDSLLKYELEKYIPVPASMVIYGYRILDEEAKETIQVLLQVFRKDDLKPFIGLKDFFPGGVSGIMLTESAVEEYETYIDSRKKVQIRGIKSWSEEDSGKIATAALALQKFNPDRKRINFLPKRFRKKPSRAAVISLGALVSLNFIALAIWGASYLIQNRIQNRQLDERLAQLRIQSVKMDGLEQRIRILEKKENEIQEVLFSRPSMLDILQQLSEITPLDTHFKEFEFKKGTVWVKGSSANASRLIEIFEASKHFSNVQFESKINIKEGQRETFIIKMTPNSETEK